MPYFLCRLATDEGRILSQSFIAPSSNECRRHFEDQGFCVLSVRRDWKRTQVSVLPFTKKIKDNDFIMFNQEFVALIKAGYPILKSIEIIINRIKNIHLKELLMLVEKDIRGGKSLSEAFSPYEDKFSKIYIASLMAGERSGNLPQTISRFIDYSRIISRTKSRVRSALTYPTLLLFFLFVMLAILLNFILPRFSDFYKDFEAELPFVTRALMSFSLSLRNNLPMILAFVFLIVLVYFFTRKEEKARIFSDRCKLKIPYGRVIWLESAVSMFARTLTLLLGGGISVVSSIDIARNAVPNSFLRHKMKGLPDSIKNGESLSDSLKKTEYFPLLAVDMIRIGEASANLEGMLKDIADVYDERVQTKIDTFVSLVEPVIIIFMGLIVAAMLLSVYLPIFNIVRVAR